jgi:D-sedoheptulose 7-phosphate isomerase
LISYIRLELGKSAELARTMRSDEAMAESIEAVATVCIQALRHGNKILFAGNGGSAADAQHIAGELISRLAFDRPGLPAFALTTDTSVLTAIGNDYGYEQLFARQISAVGVQGDVFFGISTSGRSLNVRIALAEARKRGLVTIGLTGAGGADMLPLCDLSVVIPSIETPKIQEGHITIGHIVCGLIERAMFSAHGIR